MAVALGFITIVVRRDAIETKVSGGWKAWYDKHSHLIGRICWHVIELFVISWNKHAKLESFQEFISSRGSDITWTS